MESLKYIFLTYCKVFNASEKSGYFFRYFYNKILKRNKEKLYSSANFKFAFKFP